MQGMLRRTGGLFHVTGGDSDFEAGAMLDYDDVMNHREGRDNDEDQHDDDDDDDDDDDGEDHGSGNSERLFSRRANAPSSSSNVAARAAAEELLERANQNLPKDSDTAASNAAESEASDANTTDASSESPPAPPYTPYWSTEYASTSIEISCPPVDHPDDVSRGSVAQPKEGSEEGIAFGQSRSSPLLEYAPGASSSNTRPARMASRWAAATS